MADQYLCLDQVKDDKVPPPPPATAEAQPVPPPAVAPPAPPPPVVKVPAPPAGIQKDKSDIEAAPEKKKKEVKEEEEEVESAKAEPQKSGGHAGLVRAIIGISNLIFVGVFGFWLAVLFTGLHVADFGFINKMFI